MCLNLSCVKRMKMPVNRHDQPTRVKSEIRFWFWHFMWRVWELFCSVLRIILLLTFLFIVFHNWNWALHCYSLSSSIFQMFNPLTYTCLFWIPCHQYWTVFQQCLAEDAWMARYLFANFARQEYFASLSVQNLRGSSSMSRTGSLKYCGILAPCWEN